MNPDTPKAKFVKGKHEGTVEDVLTKVASAIAQSYRVFTPAKKFKDVTSDAIYVLPSRGTFDKVKKSFPSESMFWKVQLLDTCTSNGFVSVLLDRWPSELKFDDGRSLTNVLCGEFVVEKVLQDVRLFGTETSLTNTKTEKKSHFVAILTATDSEGNSTDLIFDMSAAQYGIMTFHLPKLGQPSLLCDRKKADFLKRPIEVSSAAQFAVDFKLRCVGANNVYDNLVASVLDSVAKRFGLVLYESSVVPL